MEKKECVKRELSTKSINVINSNNDSYYVYEFLGTQVGDPISSLFLNDKYVIIGTMMGRIVLLSLNPESKKKIVISSFNPENITGLSLSDDNCFLYASVGDESIIKQEINEPLSAVLSPSSSIKMYPSELAHNMACENTYIIMATHNLIKVKIFLAELENI